MPLKPFDHCPKTLDEAITLITTALSDEEIAFIKEHGAVGAHHGFGTALRNAWLWDEKHPLSQYFRTEYGLGHADDMSGMILSGVEAEVRLSILDAKTQAEHYHAFWREQNIDPLTQEPIKP